MIFNYLLNLPSFLLRKYKSKKISFSLTSIDLLISYIFRNKKKGIFIDIGCNHPVYNNNTYLLYKKGWRGINIDLDFSSIDMFNRFRPKDYNKQIAISKTKGLANFYFFHNRAPKNTISKQSGKGAKIIKKIETDTLDNIIKKSNIKMKRIDFLGTLINAFRNPHSPPTTPHLFLLTFCRFSLCFAILACILPF